MPRPSGCADLTGATRYRDGWFGTLILQVEENYRVGHGGRPRIGQPSYVMATRWRDAVCRDLRLLDYFERQERAKAEGNPPPPPPDR